MATESQWVTFRVGQETFGFEIQYVKEMLRLPRVYPVPRAARDNLGVILLRSELIPVFDLPVKFGMESRQQKAEALASLLRERQQDHENWVEELERSVTEQREFSLTTDPHACKFGKWYDTYQTDNVWLIPVLKRFDEPHKRIHAVGAQVLTLEREGRYDEALAAVRAARADILQQLVRLFGEAISVVHDHARPSLVVVGTSAGTLGVAVDEIHAVIRCEDSEIQPPDGIPEHEQFGGLIGMLPQKGSERFVMLLDPAQLYPQLISQSATAAEG